MLRVARRVVGGFWGSTAASGSFALQLEPARAAAPRLENFTWVVRRPGLGDVALIQLLRRIDNEALDR